ncbi:MAG: hypothetical protein IJV01_07760 [Bacteroidales bacterium]|nr:hypothetical protein [Bacteroidales bacterium]
MNKFYFVSLFAATAILAGCAKQEPAPSASAPERTGDKQDLTISFKVDETPRTYINNGSVEWNSGDKVTVFDSAGGNNEFGTAAAAGASADMSGSITAGSTPAYAMYPPDGGATISSGIISTSLASEQTPSNTGSFGKCNVAVGAISDPGTGYTCELKNVCGYIKLTLPRHGTGIRKDKLTSHALTHVKQIVLSTTSGDYLAGDITVDYNSGKPLVTSVANGTRELTLDVKNYSKDGGGTFYLSGDYYFVALPGSYTGLSVTLKYDDGTPDYVRTSTGSFTVTRSQYTDIGILGDAVLNLNFAAGNTLLYQGSGGSKTYLPTSYTATDGMEVVYKYDQDGNTYNFGITTFNTTLGETAYDSKYAYHTGNQAFIFVKRTSLLHLPKIDGMALYSMEGKHSNTGAANISGTKSLYLCHEIGDLANGTAPTRFGTAAIPYFDFSQHSNPIGRCVVSEANLIKDRDWYIYPYSAASSNICVRQLILTYTKRD